MDYKKSTKQALEAYFNKQIKQHEPKRKNNKPEKLVEKQVLDWCKEKNWSVSVVESKAVFSQKAGRFLSGQAKKGFADVVGLTDEGLFVAIELKAKGRRSSLRPDQYHYLSDVIQKKGFAVCVDSPDLLESTYQEFLQAPDRIRYLLSRLPTPKKMRLDKEPLFDFD